MKDKSRSMVKAKYDLGKSLYKNNCTEILRGKRIPDGIDVIIKKSVEQNTFLPGVSRAANEYEILRTLDHKGIPKVYELYNEGEAVAMVEEYIQGENLKERIFKGSVNFDEVFNIALQLADILDYTHKQGIIHKDINTGNVMLHGNHSVMLIDFAIASNVNSRTEEMLNVDQIEGALGYISPEQTGRTAFSVGYSSDFYSLGIVLYELLAGKPPFDSADPLEVIHFHLSRNPVSLKVILPDLPDGLDQIISKLLRKNPDDRYQTAEGLKSDLEAVSAHYLSKQPLVDFKAGANDVFRHYKPSQKLYGREMEIEELLEFYGNLNHLQSMLVLVSGYSGVGKSALIRHVKFPIIQRNGRFISGKFDQFKKDIPYYAFIEAFRDFIKNVLSQTEEIILYWKQRLLSALGENAGLITEVVPQLSNITGRPPSVPKLQPAEQEARFNMVILDFIYTFSSLEYPLVIFLDDLQWADLSSLNLIKRILQNPRQENILILGAYRNNEVEQGHPLMITLDQLGNFKHQIRSIDLKPLDKATTCKIAADTFAMNPDLAWEMGEQVFLKTKGNPFFTHSFLKTLYEKKIIRKDLNSEWTWNPVEIDALGYTENVIDLMTEQLMLLPKKTQDLLKYAAVLGNTFNLADLNSVVNLPLSQICFNLKSAVKEGYLNSSDKNFRALALSSVYDDTDTEKFLLNKTVDFTFCHDKVQQAAYGLITRSEHARIHLKIGRLLLQSRNEVQLREGIFELLNLFSQGIHLIDDTAEKNKLSELCLVAGRKAKDSISYGLGVRFLEMGKNLFEPDSWTQNYELTYNTLLELGECEYLRNKTLKAEQYFAETLDHSKSKFDKLKVYYLHSSLYLKIGNTTKSLQLGMDAMELYDIRFPSDKKLVRTTTLLTLIKYLILFSTKYRNTEKLLSIEDCQDEEIIAINKFLIDLATSAYQQDQNLMMLVIFEIVKSYLKNGFTDASGFGFSGFSVVVLSSLKFQKRGFNLWELTKKLHVKTHSPLIKWRLSYTVLCFYDPWRLPFRASYDNLLETIKACTINGDQIFTGYTVALYIRIRITAGENLKNIVESSDDHLVLIKSKGGIDFFVGFYQVAKALMNQTEPGSWNDQSFNGDATLRRLEKEGNHTKLGFYHVSKTALHYYLGQYSFALNQSQQTLKYKGNLLGDVTEAWHAFYTSLSISANYENFNSTEKSKNLKIFKKHLSDMQMWSKGCPDNFAPHYLLMEGELHKIRKKFAKSMHYYEKAIKLATQYDIVYVGAIANENAALLCEKLQYSKRVENYVVDAWEAYEDWGARVKCGILENRYPDILINKKYPVTEIMDNTGKDTFVTSKTALDLASLIKASQSIAGQVKYNDLLKVLMHIIIENAGAEKGCFLLYKDNQLHIEARGHSGMEGIEILPSIPMDKLDLVPKTFVNYCWRTEESLVIEDAQKESMFADDPYIRENKPLSMMCLPVSALGKKNGLLFLENTMLKGVFDKNRISILQMLSGQIGISVENALLYENLEEKVEERTREIEKTLHELKATQTQLIHSEKMASLGELTAGIAHEIQNPLNFVNNFSEVSKELLDEMKVEMDHGNSDEAKEIAEDVILNLEKIYHHGQRASSIVKGMLEHSRSSDGKKELTNINELCDEYLRLAYHGLRAKDKSFNASMETDFDDTLPKVNVIPQDIGRVILNLITNAFYAVNEKKKQRKNSFIESVAPPVVTYQPTVTVRTRISPALEGQRREDKIEIEVQDNGNGIAPKVLGKIFQPFYTTKPTGHGTGLGLSMSYDIITKGHGGELTVNTQEGIGSIFIISLPDNQIQIEI